MISLLRSLRPSFSQIQQLDKFRGVMSAHIIDILRQDEHNKYKQCVEYMSKAMQNDDADQARVKCNLIFNCQGVSNSLVHLRSTLAELVVQNQIKSQYELDQLIKWLGKQIKINNSVGRTEIIQKLAQKNSQQTQFEQQLQHLSCNPPADQNPSNICKWLRNKYTSIDSKHIFQCVSSIFSSKQCKSKMKQVPVWEKISEVKPRQLKIECNSKQIYQMHRSITKGEQRFRFPPQPNGHLHIGHLKAIRINFQTALHLKGSCYLRYDDTNPEVQDQLFIDEIEQNIKWLGYSPSKVTFTSDYFEPLMHYAHELIKSGHAYVCQSVQSQIQLQRKEKRPNPYRNRPKEESLKIFPNLIGNQTLRLKGIYGSPNPTLRDPIIYRQKSMPHPRTHHKYKIYPTYDFSHCISDSLEHIDYSLCSLQFQIRRQLYYTFLDLLGLWKPVVWEYSRLNIEDNVLSKRTIRKYIEEGTVDSWQDPRLLTLRGLRARGYTPQMLFGFIDKVSCTRAGNENVVQYGLLQQQMKKELMQNAPKAMAVLNPFEVKISNFKAYFEQNQHKFGTKLQETVFIDQIDAENLKEGSKFILKNIGVFQLQVIGKNTATAKHLPQQNVSALKKQLPDTKILHWINKTQSTQFKVVIFNRLLVNGKPNPQSKVEHSHALIPHSLLSARPSYVQFQRIGFFKFSETGQQLHLCTRL